MTLPGADELFFRPSGTEEVPEETERQHKAPEQGSKGSRGEAPSRSNGTNRGTSAVQAARAPKPSGRQRHDEKITVYISGPELLALEQTRLSLRAEHGLSADRGRLVREAVAVLLADFEEHGPASMLVRRLSED